MPTYRERVSWPLWMHLAMGFCILVGASGVGFAALEGGGWPAIAAAAIFLSVAYAWWRLRHLSLEFGPGGVCFGFGGLNRRIPPERIASAEVESYSVSRYMGWGYRIGWKKRDRAYSIIGYRRGVRLAFDDERGRRWQVFLSARDPDAAVAALRS